MKVLLIDPPHSWYPAFEGVRAPHVGLLHIGSFLKRLGHEVLILDAATEGLDWRALAQIFRDERPHVVGISAKTFMAYSAMYTARLVKQICPDATVVGGGYHFNSVPEEALRMCGHLDFVVRGEGEQTMAALVEGLDNGWDKTALAAVPGLSFLDGDRYVETGNRPAMDINSLAIPDYDLVPTRSYSLPFFGTGGRKGGMLTTFARGCQFKCNYCSEPVLWGDSGLRQRSVKLMVDEIELLHREYGRTNFWFGDDQFTANRAHNIAFLDELEKRQLPIKYYIESRANEIARDADLLPRFRATGCLWIMLGLETPDPKKLRAWKKGHSIEQAIEACQAIKRNGIALQVMQIFGDWEDDKDTIHEIFRFTNFVNATVPTLLASTPFPQTGTLAKGLENGAIRHIDYSMYDLAHATMATKHLTVDEVHKYYNRLFKKYFGKVSHIIRHMSEPDLRVMYMVWIPSFTKAAVKGALKGAARQLVTSLPQSDYQRYKATLMGRQVAFYQRDPSWHPSLRAAGLLKRGEGRVRVDLARSPPAAAPLGGAAPGIGMGG